MSRDNGRPRDRPARQGPRNLGISTDRLKLASRRLPSGHPLRRVIEALPSAISYSELRTLAPVMLELLEAE